MQRLSSLRATSPDRAPFDARLVEACIEACVECSLVCAACADACLGEEHLDAMRACIRADLDCADLCATTARVLVRARAEAADVVRAQLEACERICQACAHECARHRDQHVHCAICSDTCAACAGRCEELRSSIDRRIVS